LEKTNAKLLRQSAASGILIGIGVIINISTENHYIGAMLFSFALLAIIQNTLPLYTGRIGFIHEYRFSDLMKILALNLIGVMLPILMALVCKENLFSKIIAASDVKFSKSFYELFLLGNLCGVLMLVAVYSKVQIITVFCIMIFILSGYEHCIADFPFLALNPSLENGFKFLCIVLGNSTGSILTYKLMK